MRWIRQVIASQDMHQGRASQAVTDLEDFLEIPHDGVLDGSPPKLDYGQISVFHLLAQAYWWTGRRDVALEMFATSAQRFEKAEGPDGKPRGPDDPEVMWQRIAHAEFLFYEGRFDDSLAEAARIGDRPLEIYGPDHDFSKFVKYVPAAIEALRERTPESVEKLEQVVNDFGRLTHLKNREFRLRRILLADAAFSAGLTAKAEEIWGQEIPNLPHDIGEVAAWGGMKSRLGSIYLDRKEYARAEPWIVEAYDDLKVRKSRLLPVYKDRPLEVADRVVRLYQEWGQPEKAAEWRKRIDQGGE